jgi:subtilase family serine protease
MDKDKACTATFQVKPQDLPDLVVSSLSNPPASVPLGGSFTVTDTTQNQGTATAGASTTRYRLSTDPIITSSDPLLTGSRSVPSLAAMERPPSSRPPMGDIL